MPKTPIPLAATNLNNALVSNIDGQKSDPATWSPCGVSPGLEPPLLRLRHANPSAHYFRWSCVRTNCRCTNTGRSLRFWQREWYRAPQTRCFKPVMKGQQQVGPRSYSYIGPNAERIQQDEPFATIELVAEPVRFHVEYLMSTEAQAQHEDLIRGDENSYVSQFVRVEPDDGSSVPPSYQASVEKKGTQRSRVFLDYYLNERSDRMDSKKLEIE